MDVNPIDVQEHVGGMSYPASRDEVVAKAEQNGAPDEILERLRSVSRDDFDGPDGVMEALGRG